MTGGHQGHVRRGGEAGHRVPVRYVGRGATGLFLPAGQDLGRRVLAVAQGRVEANGAQVDAGRTGSSCVPVQDGGEIAVHEGNGKGMLDGHDQPAAGLEHASQLG